MLSSTHGCTAIGMWNGLGLKPRDAQSRTARLPLPHSPEQQSTNYRLHSMGGINVTSRMRV